MINICLQKSPLSPKSLKKETWSKCFDILLVDLSLIIFNKIQRESNENLCKKMLQ